MTAAELDATGLRCPLPVLRARKALKKLAAGTVLRIRATDPAAVRDFESFCAETPHEFIAWAEDGGVFDITIRKR